MTTFTAQTSIVINRPAAKVWTALTNPKMIKQYLHGAQTITDWNVGSPIIWKGKWQGKSYEDKGTVIAFEPNKLLEYTHWSPMSGAADKPENYHHITYELSEDNGQTTIKFTQGNSPTQRDADTMVKTFWSPALKVIRDIS